MSAAPAPIHSLTGRAKRPSAVAFILTVVMALLAWLQTRPPAPLPAESDPTNFSAQRARAHIEAIARERRIPGTPAHTAAREYIIEQLRAAGLSPEVQTTTVVVSRWGNSAVTARNVVARLKGTNPSRAILMAGHYDTVEAAPGASDDGAAVGTLLETLRALKAGEPLRNDVIFLFTDAEEMGMLGARGFVDEHPWAAEVGLVLNFEARGTSGPVHMFEASPQNGRLLAGFLDAAPQPFTNSLAYDVYKRMPNDTDITEFKRIAGTSYLNFAYIGSGQHYHSALDNLANLPLSSLQHMGNNALAAVRAFGHRTLPVDSSRDYVWFNLIRWLVVRYPVSLALPLALIGLTVTVALLATAFRHRRVTAGGLLWGLSLFPALAVVSVGLVWGLKAGVMLPFARWFHWIPLVAVALTVAVALGFCRLLARRTNAVGLLAGALVWWALLAVGSAALLPGGSYLFVWPLLFGGVTLGYMLRDRGASPWVVGALALPAFSLMVPMVAMLFDGLYGLPEVATGLLALFMVLVVPLVGEIAAWGRWWLPTASGLLGVIVAVATLVAPHNASNPQPSTLYYWLNSNTGKATWLSAEQQPDAFTSQVLGTKWQRGAAEDFSPYRGFTYLQAEAEAQPLPAPEVQVLDDTTLDGRRFLRLRVRSQRNAPILAFYTGASVTVEEGRIDGKLLDYRCVESWCMPWYYVHFGLAAEGVEVTLTTKPGPVELIVIDRSVGLPALAKFRPAHLMLGTGPAMGLPSDSISVSRRLKL